MALRIAAVQAEAVPGDVPRNITTAVRLTAQAIDRGADLVVLPEAFATGYDLDVFRGPLPTLDDVGWLASIQALVNASGVRVLLGSAVDRGDRRTLTTVILTSGAGPASYDKQHLYPLEQAIFSAGADGVSVEIDDVEVALSVCYDANFPEHAARAAADGATVYANSGAYFPGGEQRRDLHYAARALDNGMYVVHAGLIGAPHNFIGGSVIFDPLGRAVVQLGSDEGIAVADVDRDLVATVRRGQRMWADRLPDLGERRRL